MWHSWKAAWRSKGQLYTSVSVILTPSVMSPPSASLWHWTQVTLRKQHKTVLPGERKTDFFHAFSGVTLGIDSQPAAVPQSKREHG